MTTQQDIQTVWQALIDWFEASESENEAEFETVCQAMARLQEHLEAH